MIGKAELFSHISHNNDRTDARKVSCKLHKNVRKYNYTREKQPKSGKSKWKYEKTVKRHKNRVFTYLAISPSSAPTKSVST